MSRSPKLSLEPGQLTAIATTLESAACEVSLQLADVGGVTIGRVAVCGLSGFPEQAVFTPDEMLAGVRCGLGDPALAVGLLAADPHHVMRLMASSATLRAADASPDPGLVERYLDFGREVLTGLASPLGQRLGITSVWGKPDLVEGSLAACVLSTHALPDTLLISAEISFELDNEPLPAFLYLLLDAKLQGRVVDVLTEAK